MKSKLINNKVGNFLSQERKIAGLSIFEVESTCGVDPLTFKRWEDGLSSPPANLFHKVIISLGPGAYHRATKFFCDLQKFISEYEQIS